MPTPITPTQDLHHHNNSNIGREKGAYSQVGDVEVTVEHYRLPLRLQRFHVGLQSRVPLLGAVIKAHQLFS